VKSVQKRYDKGRLVLYEQIIEEFYSPPDAKEVLLEI
jgi:hypothetical protein